MWRDSMLSWGGFQSVELFREKAALRAAKGNQETPFAAGAEAALIRVLVWNSNALGASL